MKTATTNSLQQARLLAFDFGLRRIGAAAGNTEFGTSEALTALAAKDGVPDWTQMERLVAHWLPSKLVVGLPLNMDGSEGRMATRARQFGESIRRRFRHLALEVVFVDERLSTREAEARLAEIGGVSAANKSLRGKRQKLRDGIAAQLIAQTYLAGLGDLGKEHGCVRDV